MNQPPDGAALVPAEDLRPGDRTWTPDGFRWHRRSDPDGGRELVWRVRPLGHYTTRRLADIEAGEWVFHETAGWCQVVTVRTVEHPDWVISGAWVELHLDADIKRRGPEDWTAQWMPADPTPALGEVAA